MVRTFGTPAPDRRRSHVLLASPFGFEPKFADRESAVLSRARRWGQNYVRREPRHVERLPSRAVSGETTTCCPPPAVAPSIIGVDHGRRKASCPWEALVAGCHALLDCQGSSRFPDLAEEEGFEPPIGCSRDSCLATWLLLNARTQTTTLPSPDTYRA